jgi:hypothetical protein
MVHGFFNKFLVLGRIEHLFSTPSMKTRTDYANFPRSRLCSELSLHILIKRRKKAASAPKE